jgi:hypothetical protein
MKGRRTTMKHLMIGAVAMAVLGCGAGARYPGAGPAPDESAAIGRIAYTRLAHERACQRTAPELAKLRAATEAEIHPASCKSNVHPQQLDACVADIQRWPCDVTLQAVTVIEACKTEPLCGVPPEGTL